MKRKWIGVFFCLLFLMVFITGCAGTEGKTDENVTVGKTNTELAKCYGATVIELDDSEILVDGEAAETMNADDVLEGVTKETPAVYAANDVVFYLEGQGFMYGAGSEEDEHSQKEADAHTVVHISKPGSYVISGTLSAGQIAVDLGEDAKEDEGAVVTLILNNTDITCSVAPAVIFYNVYECSSDEEEDATKDVDTQNAGANVIIADGSVNQVNGSYVARIYKSVELNEDGTEVVENKKLHKYDGAFYSKRSMNVSGEEKGNGVLNIQAENEGLDSELHLTINGGIINITAGNDGINTNEDNVSVTTVNGGTLNIVVDGATKEGDGIDSNGWLVINGGTVTAQACSFSQDAGIDSDKGIYLNGGSVWATGSMYDEIAEDSQNYIAFSCDEKQTGGNTYTIKDEEGNTIGSFTSVNDFTILIYSDETLQEGSYSLWNEETQVSVQSANTGVRGGRPPHMPEGEQPPEMPDGEQPPEMPDGEQPSNMPDGKQPPEKGDETEYVPQGNPMQNGKGDFMDLDKMK